ACDVLVVAISVLLARGDMVPSGFHRARRIPEFLGALAGRGSPLGFARSNMIWMTSLQPFLQLPVSSCPGHRSEISWLFLQRTKPPSGVPEPLRRMSLNASRFRPTYILEQCGS